MANTFSTTYNFYDNCYGNNKGMNFGKALLSGIGYNALSSMGMGGLMGMGGSIYGFGCGSGFGYTPFSNCGVSDGYAGAAVGMTVANVLTSAISGRIQSQNEEKATYSEALTNSLKTLNISKPSELPSNAQTSDYLGSYNTDIKTAITKAIAGAKFVQDDYELNPGAKPKQADYTETDSEGNAILDKEAFETARTQWISNTAKHNQAVDAKNKIDTLQSINAETITSSEAERLLEDKAVVSAIKAREEKEAEITKAINLVKQAKQKEQAEELRGGAKSIEISKNQNVNKTWSSFLKALKKLSKDPTNTEAKGALKTTCNTILEDTGHQTYSEAMFKKAEEAKKQFGIE